MENQISEEVIKQDLLRYGIDCDSQKIGEVKCQNYLFEIFKYLWDKKGQFVSREELAEIRKKYYKYPNVSRNMAPEISRILKEINDIFIQNKIDLSIVSVPGKVMLIKI